MTDQQLIIRLLYIKRLVAPDLYPDMDQAIEAVINLQKIKEITARALKSEDPINLYKSLCLKEISEILGVKVKDPAEAADSKGQITFDDII